MNIRPKLRVRPVFATVLVASIALTGCQTGTSKSESKETEVVTLAPLETLTPLENPRLAEGPVTVAIGGPSLAPPSTEPDFSLPVTVVSKRLDGSTPEVTVTDNSRVLALSVTGSLADIVVSLGFGSHLVGRDLATTAPGTEDLPLVTTASHTINSEAVLSLQPTLIFTDGSIGPDDALQAQMKSAGVPVVSVERIIDFDTTFQATRDVAAAFGAPQSGEELVLTLEESITAKLEEIKRLIPEDPERIPRVVFLYLRGNSGIYFMFGKESGVDSIIQAVGLIDIASEAGWRGEKPLTPEALPAMNPDAILVMSNGLKSVGGVDGLLQNVVGIAQTPAGKNRRIIDIDDTLLFAGASRTADVLDGLARVFYTSD